MVTVTLNSTSCSTDTLAQPIPSDVLHGELCVHVSVHVCVCLRVFACVECR